MKIQLRTEIEIFDFNKKMFFFVSDDRCPSPGLECPAVGTIYEGVEMRNVTNVPNWRLCSQWVSNINIYEYSIFF